MSNTDSFIEEVTEEVRRDRLYALMRRWGWVPVLVILLLVGGAAYNEWRKAGERAAAQSTGDALLAALDQNDAAARAEALAQIDVDGERKLLVDLLLAAESQAAEDADTARATLTTLAGDASLPRVYRDLATLKLILLDQDSPVADRRARLEPLATAGAPYRLIAEEQLALLDVADGQGEQAIDRLKAILDDTDVSPGLRRRASQLIVALGGSVEGL